MTASAEERAGRRLWIGIPGPSVDDATRKHLLHVRPGGVILFGRNIESTAQVRALVRELRDLCGAALRVSIDQEGGKVVRFARELTVFPGNTGSPVFPSHDLSAVYSLENLGRGYGT